MTADAGPPAVQIAVKTASQNPLADRFNVAVEKCDVSNKQKLVQYRKKWMDWMSWYGYGDLQPNSIETQIHRMLFNDLTYRATVSVRASVDANIPISLLAHQHSLTCSTRDTLSHRSFPFRSSSMTEMM